MGEIKENAQDIVNELAGYVPNLHNPYTGADFCRFCFTYSTDNPPYLIMHSDDCLWVRAIKLTE